MKKAIFLVAAFLAATMSAQAEQIWLTMDQVRPYRLEAAAQSIIVGNPAIADVTVQDNKNILLFGKAPGLTNMYIFDENGEPSGNLIIRVRSHGPDMLTYYRGSARRTYNCTSNCEATITVGDDSSTFSEVTSQVQNKSKAAEGASSAE